MKKILIDASIIFSLLRKKNPLDGFGRVTLAYAMFYKKQMQLVVYSKIFRNFIVFPEATSKNFIELLAKSSVIPAYKIYWLIITHGLLGLFKKNKLSNYFFIKVCTRGLQSPFYLNILKKRNVKMIAVLHDLIPIERAELFSPKQTTKFSLVIHNMVKNSIGIIAVSSTEREKFLNYLSIKGCICPPIIYSGLASSLQVIDSTRPRPIIAPYFVIVGSVSASRKNHLLLLKVWLNIVKQYGSSAPKLVILGKIKQVKQEELGLLLKNEQLKNVVSRLEVDDDTLINYLHHAEALLTPSLAEGYGLPLIEALSLGTPVIANNLPVFHEIAGDVPDYIESSDENRWLEYVVDYLTPDSLLRKNQLERIKDFVIPTWDQHFQRVDKFLDNLDGTTD